MKNCARCDTTKDAAEFGKNAGRKDGLAVYCRACTKSYMAGKTYDKDRWANMREKESARNKDYRARSADRLLPAHREKAARRRKERPELVNAGNKARKAAQRQAIPAWADRAQISTMYRKAKELSAVFGVELQVDHVVPLRGKLVCGLHTPANLQLLAKDLNHTKRNWSWPDMP